MHLGNDKYTTRTISVVSTEACAQNCTAEPDCRFYAMAGFTRGISVLASARECHMYTDAHGRTGGVHPATVFPTFACRKHPRHGPDSFTDTAARYTFTPQSDVMRVFHDLPQVQTQFGTDASVQVFIEGCADGQLAVAACNRTSECTDQDIMRQLDGEVRELSQTSMIRSGEERHAAYSIGCIRSDIGDGSFEDCVPPDRALLGDLEAGFYYKTDQTGRPDGFTVHQHRGHMLFRWEDFSSCEQSFALTRQTRTTAPSLRWGAEESFARDYSAHGGRPCGEHVEPADYSDNLITSGAQQAKRTVGTRHRYCLSAMSENGAAAIVYKSSPACFATEVIWESAIVGQVTGKKDNQPVPNVVLEWHVNGTALRGTAHTDDDGRFELYIRDPANQLDRQARDPTHWRTQTDTVDVTVHVSKGNDPFLCQYDIAALCGGKDETTNTLFPDAVFVWQATYLKFDSDFFNFRRLTHAPIVPVDGVVYFPITHHVFRAGDVASMTASPAGEAQLPWIHPDTAGLKRCFVHTGATMAVCMKDYEMQESVIKCVGTNGRGEYHIAAPIGSRVFLEVSYKNHVFVLDRPNIDAELQTQLPSSTRVPGQLTDVTVLTVPPDPSKLLRVDFQVMWCNRSTPYGTYSCFSTVCVTLLHGSGSRGIVWFPLCVRAMVASSTTCLFTSERLCWQIVLAVFFNFA